MEPPYVTRMGAMPARGRASPDGSLTPQAFETLARRVLGDWYGVTLAPGTVSGVPRRFDLVSPDGDIVGDAKCFTGSGLERFSTIAEHVWLLEKTGAPTTFLVFGNDREALKVWLERYGGLVFGVTCYFLHDDGRLEVLNRLDDAVE